jgi:hypothetical protein
MTKAEWLACTDPLVMLQHCESLLSERKWRLYRVACCRSIWRHINHGHGQRAVLVAERFADGEATLQEMTESCEAVRAITDPGWQSFRNGHDSRLESTRRTLCALTATADAASEELRFGSGPNVAYALGTYQSAASLAEFARQASFLRCLVGEAFGPPVIVSEWRTTTAVALAAHVYDSRDFSVLPILADALEDAGCDNTDVFDHCRGPGPHVRGCWVVDALLGKE